MDHLIIIWLLLGGGCCCCYRSARRSSYRAPDLPDIPWKAIRNVLKAIGICFAAFFLVATACALFMPPAIVPAPLVLLGASLILWAMNKYRKRWWRAYDESGRPIDIEVLPPAPIAKT